jgi:hypothetical protein
MFFIINARKTLFGERFASFKFGWRYEIRKIRTDKIGNEFAWCHGRRINPKEKDWMEL